MRPIPGTRRGALARLATRSLLLPLLGACASAGSRGAQPTRAEESVRPDSVVVRAVNHSDRALTISVAHGDAELRLGEVSAGGEARFSAPAADVAHGPIALVARSSHESVRTATFKAHGGQVVWFDLAPGLDGSRVRVRWPEEGRPR
jgi:hypothetical protein